MRVQWGGFAAYSRVDAAGGTAAGRTGMTPSLPTPSLPPHQTSHTQTHGPTPRLHSRHTHCRTLRGRGNTTTATHTRKERERSGDKHTETAVCTLTQRRQRQRLRRRVCELSKPVTAKTDSEKTPLNRGEKGKKNRCGRGWQAAVAGTACRSRPLHAFPLFKTQIETQNPAEHCN